MGRIILTWAAACAAALAAQIAYPETAVPRRLDSSADIPAASLAELRWRSIGPTEYSGRVDCLAVPRAGTPGVGRTGSVIYAGGAGGIWKTTNAGASWFEVFDKTPFSGVRSLALAPSNQQIVWAGTGFLAPAQHGPVPGAGVFKSVDAGANWQSMGLASTQYIMRIAVHPENPDIVLVAAQGPVTRASRDRGVYLTTDGGQSWKQVLFVDEWTGVADLVRDPADPRTVYAAAWQHAQNEFGWVEGGPHSGIFKSTDGGVSWSRLAGGLPAGALGRIQLAIAPSRPRTVYALVPPIGDNGYADSARVYRSDDGGGHWTALGQAAVSSYYDGIEVDPLDPERIYIGDGLGAVSTDGGRTVRPVAPMVHSRNSTRAPYTEIHDVHAIWIDPDNPSHLMFGSDYGLAVSEDRAQTFLTIENMPLALVWQTKPDPSGPFYRIHVSVRDNDTFAAPNRTRARQGVLDGDWYPTGGGEQVELAPDPIDPDRVYIDRDGLRRHDAREQLVQLLSPPSQPGEVNSGSQSCAVSAGKRRILYCVEGNRLLTSKDGGIHWQTSNPLPRVALANPNGRDRLMGQPVLPQRQHDLDHEAITAIADSAVDAKVIYIGIGERTVAVTRDGGRTWRQHTIPHAPARPVFRIATSPTRPGRAYAALTEVGSDDRTPYLFVTNNYGATWQSGAGDLPDDARVWTVAEHPHAAELLFAATDRGVYFSRNGGGHWQSLRSNLPGAAVRSIDVQSTENDLVIGVWGRGVWVLDDTAPLANWADTAKADPAHLFPIRRTPLYIERKSPHIAPFHGANPPFGALIAYYLSRDMAVEEEPRLEVYAKDGQHLLAIVPVERTAGLHRTAWDLQEVLEGPADPMTQKSPRVLVVPGTYVVRLTWAGGAGKARKVVSEQTVQVQADAGAGLSEADYIALYRYRKRSIAFERRFTAAGEVIERYSAKAQQGTASHGVLKEQAEHYKRLEGFMSSLRQANWVADATVPAPAFVERLTEAEALLNKIELALRKMER